MRINCFLSCLVINQNVIQLKTKIWKWKNNKILQESK